MGENAVSAEVIEIQTMMRDDRAAYFANPDIQERYRSILSSGGEGEDGAEHVIPLPTPSAWRAVGNDPKDYQAFRRLVSSINDMMTRLPQSEGKTMIQSFDRLPVEAQNLMQLMLVDRRPVSAEPFTWGAVDELCKSDPAMKMLRDEWRDESPMRFAIAQRRLLTVLALLPEAKADAVSDWFRGLSVNARAAMVRVLGR